MMKKPDSASPRSANSKNEDTARTGKDAGAAEIRLKPRVRKLSEPSRERKYAVVLIFFAGTSALAAATTKNIIPERRYCSVSI